MDLLRAAERHTGPGSRIEVRVNPVDTGELPRLVLRRLRRDPPAEPCRAHPPLRASPWSLPTTARPGGRTPATRPLVSRWRWPGGSPSGNPTEQALIELDPEQGTLRALGSGARGARMVDTPRLAEALRATPWPMTDRAFGCSTRPASPTTPPRSSGRARWASAS